MIAISSGGGSMTGLLKLVGKCVLFFCIWGAVISGVVLYLVQYAGDGWARDLGPRYLVEIFGVAGLVAGLLLIGLVLERRGWLSLGLRLSSAPIGIVGGTAFGIAISFVTILVLASRGEARFDFGNGALALGVIGPVLGLTFLNVLQQELLVRSYVFQAIDNRYGGAWAVCWTTIIFVALHAGALSPTLAGAIAALNLTLAGVLLGLAVLSTRSIWLAVGVHSGWNVFQVLFLNTDITKSDLALGDWRPIAIDGQALWTGGSVGLEAGVAGLVGPAVGVALIALFAQGLSRRAG